MQSRKTASIFTGKPNAFDTFRCLFAKRAPKRSRNDRLYIRNSHQPFRRLQNVVLLRVPGVLPSRKTASKFTDEPTAFLIVAEAFSRKGHRKCEETTGFIGYFMNSMHASKRCFTKGFDVLQSRETHLTFTENPNAF